MKRSVEGLSELLLKEQFFSSCPKELVVHLRLNERSLSHLVKYVETFLSAHGETSGGGLLERHRHSTKQVLPAVREEKPQTPGPETKVGCYACHISHPISRHTGPICSTEEPALTWPRVLLSLRP